MDIKVKYAVGDSISFINNSGTTLTGEVKEIIIHIQKDSAKITYKVDVQGKPWKVVSVLPKTEKE